VAVAKGWQPYHLHLPTVLKSGSLKLLEPSGPLQACNGIALPFYFLYNIQKLFQHLIWILTYKCINKYKSAVSLVNNLGLGQSGVQFLEGKRFFTSSKWPDQLRDSPNGLFDGYTWEFFARGQRSRCTKLTTHIHLVMRFKNEWSCISTAPLTFYPYLWI